MAIRIRPDDNGGGGGGGPHRPHNPGGGGGGGMGGLIAFLPMIFSIFRKNPKMGMLIAILAGGYFLFKGGCNLNLPPGDDDGSVVSPFSMGMEHDPVKYGNTSVSEPLANNRKNPLPESISLLEFAPKRLNQGRQGSCVGWATTYAGRTILHSRQTGTNPDRLPFSPSYTYNQVHLPNCQGTYLPDALAVMKKGGTLPLSDFPYDESSCDRQPTGNHRQKAANYRIKDYLRLTQGRSSGQKPDLLGIKQNVAAGAPVIIGMMVGGTFMRAMEGRELWRPTQQDYAMRGFGGHAMCVIGYDDYKANGKGAFEIMNSWGGNWGKDGVAWVSYDDFAHFTKEAYGLYPMGSAQQEADEFVVDFGIVKNDGKLNVAFKESGKNTFRTVTPMKKDENFKIEVTNSVECYIYVFSQETDGKIFTLFPYNAKHSPYCGIKGTRLFPKDASLYPDKDGNLDYMGVVITREPMDYVAAEKAFNQASGSMAQRMESVLSDQLLTSVRMSAGKTIKLDTKSKGKNAVYVVMEIDKQ